MKALMQNEVNILKESMGPLTKMLSGMDIPVHFRGTDAMTVYDPVTNRPKEIVLPMISGNVDHSVIAAFNGYLDHEVGHVLFSNMAEVPVERIKSNIEKYVCNIVEDPRIEKLMCRNFKGSAFNLNGVHSFVFNDDFVKDVDSKSADDPNAIVSRLIVVARALSGQNYFENMVSESKSCQALYDRLEHFKPRFDALSSYSDSVALAKDIVKELEIQDLEAPEMSPPDKEKDPESKSESDDPMKQEGIGRKKDDECVAGEAEAREKPDDRKDLFETMMAKRLSSIAQEVNSSETYRIYTTDLDKVESAKVEDDPVVDRWLERIEADVMKMTGTIQKNLERAIAARSMVVWTAGHRSGKLNASSLCRVITGDDRVFAKKQQAFSRDVAVSLVVDCSGSMSGDRIEMALTAAYALGTVLNRMKISFEIIGFTTNKDHFSGKRIYDYDYARYDGLYLPIFKSFNERWDSIAKRRIATTYAYQRILRNNVDGESVQISANRLLAQKEVGKIMIVLSDGEPSADGDDRQLDGHLKKTIKNLEKYIKIIGIGIQCRSVERYYTNNVSLNNLEDLPCEVISKIRKMLIES